MTPKVSVLMAAKNAAATIASALRSVQRQSLSDWQCVVIDDHSTDETKIIADEFAGADSRFSIYSLADIPVLNFTASPPGPDNPATSPQSTTGDLQSLVDARNYGLFQCNADWIAILDADDCMHKHRLALQLNHATSHNADVVGSRVRYFPRRLVGDGMLRYESWLNKQTAASIFNERFIEMPIAHPTMLIRRSLLDEIGGYQNCGWPEDYDLFLRLAAAGARFAQVAKPLLSWRWQEHSTSRSHPAYSLAAIARCRAHYLAHHFLTENGQYVQWGFGDTGSELTGNLRALGKNMAAVIEVHPGRIGQRIHGARVFHPDDYFKNATEIYPILVSVAGEKPRLQIRKYFDDLGLGTSQLSKSLPARWREGREYIFTA